MLVVTAPGSGAEIIPFLKTWVNLPMAIGFTVLYSAVRGGRSAPHLRASGCGAPSARTAPAPAPHWRPGAPRRAPTTRRHHRR